MLLKKKATWDCFKKYYNEKYQLIAGLDEVGRGALAGPVVVAIVVFNSIEELEGIEDSKVLTAIQREKYSKQIIKSCKYYAIGQAEANEIDKMNILNATKLASRRSLDSLEVKPDLVLCDGSQKLLLDIPCIEIVKGDASCIPISAASILAKVYRDQLMVELSEKHPEYEWHKNKGYGSRSHIASIKKNGITSIHRQSFLGKVIENSNLFVKM